MADNKDLVPAKFGEIFGEASAPEKSPSFKAPEYTPPPIRPSQNLDMAFDHTVDSTAFAMMARKHFDGALKMALVSGSATNQRAPIATDKLQPLATGKLQNNVFMLEYELWGDFERDDTVCECRFTLNSQSRRFSFRLPHRSERPGAEFFVDLHKRLRDLVIDKLATILTTDLFREIEVKLR